MLTPVDAVPSRPLGPGRELAADLRHPQLTGGGHPEKRRARHACAAEARLGLDAERAAGGPALGRGECGAVRGVVGRARWAVPRKPGPVAFPVQPATEDIVASEQSLGQKLVIWGTDVNVATCKENFQVRFGAPEMRGKVLVTSIHVTPVFRSRSSRGSELVVSFSVFRKKKNTYVCLQILTPFLVSFF